MLLLAVEEPLDLDPDFQVSRISNATRFVEYEHLLPHKRRKYNSAEIEAEKTEREEKLKLLTLMDDRKNHGEFLPSFNRVSFINEWRHKKYVSDGEVYPAALPPPAMPPAAGKKTAAKRSRSQMSMFADGRRVVRTLRFVQTINGRLIYTVFHVLELPDGGLQGVMRWGTLPDTSINGGSKVFAFPDEEIMRMHIDNFKLLLHIENNRLVYDSAYPNGIPTADLPPPLLATPTVSPRTSANPVPTASPAVGTGVAAAASAVSSPAIASSSVAQSPDIASVASPPAKDAQKSKSSVAKKGAGARNSRKNSPSKSKSAIARPASAEVELDTSPPPKSTKGLHKAKASAEAKRRAAAAAAKEESPVSVSSTDSATALVEGVSTKDDDAENAAAVPKPKKSASKASLSSLSQTTVGDEGGKTPTAAKEKKGAQAKAPRKTPTTKEKKPRAKAKSAAASKDSAAALLPATESAELAPSLSVNDDVSAVGAAASTGDGAFASDDDDAPLVQNPDSTAATGARSASNEAPLAQTPAAGAAAPLLVSSSPATASTPAAANPSAGQAPMAQAALAQFNLQLAAMAQGGAGRPPFEMPKHITKEYLQAHPEYLAMLRQQMAHVLLQQRQQFQQQQQQQQLQAASNMSNSSAGPMGSPQIRPNAAAHPNMSAMAHMMQSMQNSPASAVAGGPVPQTAGNTGMPAVASTSPMNPTLGSPTMRPAVGLPGAPNGITAAQMQQLQQLQPTNEELAIIQQYLRIKGIQLQGVQDPRFLILVAKAKTGELKSMLLTHIQALASQQQQQQQQHQQSSVPVQNSPALANPLPANPAPALAMNQVPGAVGQQQAVRPMQLPLDPANLSLQDRARLLELVQKQREAQLNGAAPGSMPNPLGAPTQPQPALAAAMAAAALQRQQQQQLGLAAANPAGAVSAMQAQMARSVQLPGAAGPAQPRPAAPMLGSPSSAPANAPQSAMALAQRQALQQAALANMSPQQRQEAIQRIQQAAAMAATVNRAPQVNVPIILQQLSSGQISPAMMPPHLISFLLHNAQAQLTPEQRVALQRILALHMQQQQAQNNAAAGPIRPGAAQ
ncbi:Transcription factor spt20 [Coemansia thaxteri]|nr:Transcription factor spt20 [Coemansia thaxteri]